MIRGSSVFVVLVVALAACSGESNKDGGSGDAGGGLDARAPDARGSDAQPSDQGSSDAAPMDLGTIDAGATDSGANDAGASDAPIADTASADAGLGDGPNDAAAPDASPPDTGTCVAAIYGDYYVKNDNTVWRYGSGSTSPIMNGSTNQPLVGILEIIRNQFSGCALLTDHTVWCWATAALTPTYGALGNGSTTGTVAAAYLATQVQVPPVQGQTTYLTAVASLQRGKQREYQGPTCAIRMDSTVWCWGPSTDGNLIQTGANVNVPYATQIYADATTPLTADLISVGTREACVLQTGQAKCWGANIGGGLAQGDTTARTYPVAIPGLPASVTNVQSGTDFNCAQAGGAMYCWGATAQGEAGIGPMSPSWSICNSNYCVQTPMRVLTAANTPLDMVDQAIMGYIGMCAIQMGGRIVCWGAIDGANHSDYATPLIEGMGAVANVRALTLAGTGGYLSSAITIRSDGRYFVGAFDATSTVCP